MPVAFIFLIHVSTLFGCYAKDDSQFVDFITKKSC